MKTTRTLIIAALGVLMTAPALLADVKIGAELRITPRPRQDLEVYVWPDRGMDGVYYPGEQINVNVEVTRDAFLILYNIDTRGRLTILFPSSPWDDNFVEAGDVITLPRRWDEFDWTVEGPAGTEYIQAIASEIPISLPEWPIYMKRVNMPSHISPHPDMRDFKAGSDRYDYMDVVNRNLCGRYYDWCATDVATFHVRPYPRYHHVNDWDPWPDVFYGEIYIGWPLGARIYVDNIYIGIAPCWVPRHYSGRRVITCYDGQRLIRRHEVRCYAKRDYYAHNKHQDLRGSMYKKGRSDAYDHFRIEKSDGDKKYRVSERSKVKVYGGDDDGIDDSYRRKMMSSGKAKTAGRNEDGGAYSRKLITSPNNKSANRTGDDNDRNRPKVTGSREIKTAGRDDAVVVKRETKISRDEPGNKTRSSKVIAARIDRDKQEVTVKSSEKNKNRGASKSGKRSRGRD